jgi:hypothetical protein
LRKHYQRIERRRGFSVRDFLQPRHSVGALGLVIASQRELEQRCSELLALCRARIGDDFFKIRFCFVPQILLD